MVRYESDAFSLDCADGLRKPRFAKSRSALNLRTMCFSGGNLHFLCGIFYVFLGKKMFFFSYEKCDLESVDSYDACNNSLMIFRKHKNQFANLCVVGLKRNFCTVNET